MTTVHRAMVQRVSPQREGASIATPHWLPASKTFEGSRRSGRFVARAKLMSEHMRADASAAYNLRYVILRYFNVAGAGPAGRPGQSTPGATGQIKVVLETDFADAPT
jgi:UDP-glucose 4-epimerase